MTKLPYASTPSAAGTIAVRPQTRTHRKRAFSLVEVALALGIFGFSVVPVIGMMGIALNVGRESVESATLGEIYSKVESITASGKEYTAPIYFSASGELTTASDPKVVFQVSIAAEKPDDSVKGILARNILQVSVARTAAPSEVLSKRFLQSSKEPTDLQSYF